MRGLFRERHIERVRQRRQDASISVSDVEVIPFVTNAFHWVEVLRSYGLDARMQSLRNMTDEQRIHTLKNALRTDAPVMLGVGNGYRGRGIWSRIRWQLISHWITLWGFDDEKGVFYIYDSGVPPRYYDKGISIGNVARTYQQVARDIRGGQPWWQRYRCITIRPSLKEMIATIQPDQLHKETAWGSPVGRKIWRP